MQPHGGRMMLLRPLPRAILSSVVLHADLYDATDQVVGQRLLGGEAKRSLAAEVRPELLFVLLVNTPAHRVQAAMLLERGVGDEQPAAGVSERRHLIRHCLGRVGSHLLDDPADMLERGTVRLWDRGEVLFYAGSHHVNPGQETFPVRKRSEVKLRNDAKD